MASCAATIVRPARWLDAPTWPRLASVSVSRGSRRVARTAVTSPSADRDDRGQSHRERQHRPAQRHLVESRQIRGRERQQRADAQRGDEQTGEAADDQQQNGFGHELPDDASASGAERVTDGELASARGGLREQKIRHVRARDEQQEEHGAEQHVQRRADAAGERRLQRHRRRVRHQIVALLVGTPDDVLRDGADVRVRLRRRSRRRAAGRPPRSCETCGCDSRYRARPAPTDPPSPETRIPPASRRRRRMRGSPGCSVNDESCGDDPRYFVQ